MKQSNISATIIMSIISFASCTNDIENLDIIPTNNGQNTEGNIILQERNPNLPLPLIKKFIPEIAFQAKTEPSLDTVIK